MMRALIAALIVLGALPANAQELRTASDVAVRAEALLGLGRVARDAGRMVDAETHFRESETLRPFDDRLRGEYFWVLVNVDARRAMQLAQGLAMRQAADAPILEKWLTLALERRDEEQIAQAATRALQRYPNTARWPRQLGQSLLRSDQARAAADAFGRAAAAPDGTTGDRAMRALAFERAGDLAAANEAWQQVPDAMRRQRADWWASELRAQTAVRGGAAMAGPLATYVREHPADAGMRAVAIEALASAGQPTRVLALLTPFLQGADSARWRRREGELALQAGDRGRAAEAFSALQASGWATANDQWRLLEVIAPDAPVPDVLARLAALTPPVNPCTGRDLRVADLSDKDEVFAWVARSRGEVCPLPERLALRAARWIRARGMPADAEPLLRRALDTEHPSDAVVLALAEHLVARDDAEAADTLLAAQIAGKPDTAAFALVAAQAWARARRGRPAEGWAVVAPRLEGETLTPDARTAWAGLALAAGQLDAAATLAHEGLQSAADRDARQVLASIAQRRGQQRQAYQWLAPIANSLTSAVAARSWLDAVAGVYGPAVALEYAHGLPAAARQDIDIARQLALWATAAGLPDEASDHAATVAALDPARGALLALERAVAAGRPGEVVTALAPLNLSDQADGTIRLAVTAALDANAWTAAQRALVEWDARAVDEEWSLAKSAQLWLGREGRLPDDVQRRLDARLEGGAASDELLVRRAQADAARGEVAAGLARLGWPALDERDPIIVREAVVGILLAAGRPADVLDLVSESTMWPAGLLAARARALIALNQPDAARRAIVSIPESVRRVDEWRTLSSLAAEEQRLDLLERAVGLWPDSAALWASLASARQLAGHPVPARDAAGRALALDVHQRDAWLVRLSLAPSSDAERFRELVTAGQTFAAVPETLLDCAEAAMRPGLSDPQSVALIDGWFALPEHGRSARSLRIRARLAVATGNWGQAIEAVDAARALEPDDLALRRLETQIHAWSGRHETAADGYRAYLDLAPGDAEAWREYARVLAWTQRAAASQAAYAEAASLAPLPAIGAEMRTKAALARRAWRLAAREAAMWASLEPDSLDARMDRALALDRSGAVDAAAPLFAGLSLSTALPSDLRDAAARYDLAHRPGAQVQMVSESSRGYGSQRLLEQRVVLARASDLMGRGGRARVYAEGGRGSVGAGDRAWAVTQAQAGGDVRLARGWQAAGQLGWIDLGGAAGHATGRVGVAGTPADGLRWSLEAERRPFWENGATVEHGLRADGVSTGLQWLPSSRWLIEGEAKASRLTDGNVRREASGSAALRGSAGARDLQLRSSVMLFGYRDPVPMYFSPDRFVRTDIEGEVRHWFGRPRVDGDLRPSIAAGLGLGVDSRQATYGLGHAALTLPLGGPWALVGEGRWVRASVYESSRAVVWIQAGGSR